jgi:hypothetical protein
MIFLADFHLLFSEKGKHIDERDRNSTFCTAIKTANYIMRNSPLFNFLTIVITLKRTAPFVPTMSLIFI